MRDKIGEVVHLQVRNTGFGPARAIHITAIHSVQGHEIRFGQEDGAGGSILPNRYLKVAVLYNPEMRPKGWIEIECTSAQGNSVRQVLSLDTHQAASGGFVVVTLAANPAAAQTLKRAGKNHGATTHWPPPGWV